MEYVVGGIAVLVLLAAGFYFEPWLNLIEPALEGAGVPLRTPRLMENFPLISLLFLTLPLGAALAWLLPRPESARVIALTTALIDLVVAGVAVFVFDPAQAGFQLVEKRDWIPSLNIHYMVGVDGISVLFLPATVLLFIGVILASWNSVHTLPRLYYSLLMLFETATLGVFCALDSVLFFLFWEFTLMPLYFLVRLWGVGPNRRHAAMKYTLVMLAGGVPLLFGFLLLAFGAATAGGGPLVFDLPTLLATPLPSGTQYAVFLLLLVGFGVKVPLLPLHTWLPLIAMEGPVAVCALLTGLKLGAYGLIRFAVPLAPAAAQELHWLLAASARWRYCTVRWPRWRKPTCGACWPTPACRTSAWWCWASPRSTCRACRARCCNCSTSSSPPARMFLLASFLHHRTGSTDVATPSRRRAHHAAAGKLLPALRPGRHGAARHLGLPGGTAAVAVDLRSSRRRRAGRAGRHGDRRRLFSRPVPPRFLRPGDAAGSGHGGGSAAARTAAHAGLCRTGAGLRLFPATVARCHEHVGRGLGGAAGVISATVQTSAGEQT